VFSTVSTEGPQSPCRDSAPPRGGRSPQAVPNRRPAVAVCRSLGSRLNLVEACVSQSLVDVQGALPRSRPGRQLRAATQQPVAQPQAPIRFLTATQWRRSPDSIKSTQPLHEAPNARPRLELACDLYFTYSIRIPEMAREMTNCWICSVPSKMSWISRFEGKIPAQGTSVDHKTRVFGPETHIYSPICKQFLVLRKGSIDS